MPTPRPIEERVVPGVALADRSPRAVAYELDALLAHGATLRPDGEARDDPELLRTPRYRPLSTLTLFGTRFFLTGYGHDDDLDFLVGFVVPDAGGRAPSVHPRIFYKDVSLVWRVATHVVRTDEENWIGKGAVVESGDSMTTAEETTNLPYEMQAALDVACRLGPHDRRDVDAVPLVLRAGGTDRIEPFADFTAPRRRAARRFRLNGGRRVARFVRAGDPRSLRFARGCAPDLRDGVLETAWSASRFYGGAVAKVRVLSENRRVQYQFVATPTHVWVNPPQALTTELSSYGTRTVDVPADEELFVPGYEYHFLDDTVDPPELYSQIPEGFAGDDCPGDGTRCDASAWIERLPVVREFRRRVLPRLAPDLAPTSGSRRRT